jgi:hypothetical protein
MQYSLHQLPAEQRKAPGRSRGCSASASVRHLEAGVAICGRLARDTQSGQRIFLSRARSGRSSDGQGQTFRRRSRNAWMLRSRDVENHCALLPPVGFAWVMVGAQPALAVALCADVKNAFGVVVATHVSRRTGTAGAELYSHVLPPEVKRPTSSPAHRRLRPGGATVALGLFGRDR